MGWVLRQPTFPDAELQRRARIAMSVVRVVLVAVGLVVSLSLLDPRNLPSRTLLFYAPVVLSLLGAAWGLHRGAVDVVGWGVALTVWATVTAVLVVFGGLEGHNAMAFIVATTIAGTIVNGRAAIIVGALSIASTLVTYALESRGLLPPTLAPVSTFNSVISVTVSMMMAGWLLALSLSSMQRALDAEREASKARDLAHAAALRAQRLESVGRLAAGVAHDLNNVLSVVQLTSDALRAEANDKAQLRPLVDDLAQAADNAALLSRRMVTMSRSGGSPPELLEVGAVANHFAPLLRRLLPPQSRLLVKVETPLQVTASRSALEHVMLNLVVNARDAMPKGGAIEVVVRGRELQVRDEGVGMTPETRAKLFTPFFTTRENGTGLGLANVAELAASMKAEVKVESEPGAGSTFRVVFPG